MTIHKKILLVESNLFIGGVLSQRLRADGFIVISSKNGKDGLYLLASEKPSIVFLDLPIGKIRIFLAVLSQLSKRKNIIFPPIIVLSSVETSKDITQLSDLGVNAYLAKAYTDTGEMIAKIKEILAPDSTKLAQASTSQVVATNLADSEPIVSEEKRIRAEIERAIVSHDEDAPIIALVDNLIFYAFLLRASDIHFKPEADRLSIRMRVDGVLQEMFAIPRSIQTEVITRIKVLSGMRTDEHQSAQDGRFKTNIHSLGRQFDIRVSVVPTYYGENSVLRLLVEQSEIRSLGNIAFSPKDRQKIDRAITKPNGMILATGPTGSGKTTTLYTILRELNKPDVSIITIEDPIEYSLTGVNQIQVNAQTGLTFSDGLRSILRQDPDIIMVGEIRDKETASIAVNASLTGHLLLSTLHTNDAATTLPRLLDMGIEPFLIASTVNVALGQRLIRMLCQKCKVKRPSTALEKKHLATILPAHLIKNAPEFFHPKGCPACSDLGYMGRIGIYEVLEIDDTIREAIMRRANSGDIKKIAIEHGMTTLLEDGFQKAVAGLTTLEELFKAVTE